jgi:hypothetical protein
MIPDDSGVLSRSTVSDIYHELVFENYLKLGDF